MRPTHVHVGVFGVVYWFTKMCGEKLYGEEQQESGWCDGEKTKNYSARGLTSKCVRNLLPVL